MSAWRSARGVGIAATGLIAFAAATEVATAARMIKQLNAVQMGES